VAKRRHNPDNKTMFIALAALGGLAAAYFFNASPASAGGGGSYPITLLGAYTGTAYSPTYMEAHTATEQNAAPYLPAALVEHMQKWINALNTVAQANQPKLDEDGDMGPLTAAALHRAVALVDLSASMLAAQGSAEGKFPLIKLYADKTNASQGYTLFRILVPRVYNFGLASHIFYSIYELITRPLVVGEDDVRALRATAADMNKACVTYDPNADFAIGCSPSGFDLGSEWKTAGREDGWNFKVPLTSTNTNRFV
jgi:hypothetical protein